MEEIKNTIKFTPDYDQTPDYKFRLTVYLFSNFFQLTLVKVL